MFRLLESSHTISILISMAEIICGNLALYFKLELRWGYLF